MDFYSLLCLSLSSFLMILAPQLPIHDVVQTGPRVDQLDSTGAAVGVNDRLENQVTSRLDTEEDDVFSGMALARPCP